VCEALYQLNSQKKTKLAETLNNSTIAKASKKIGDLRSKNRNNTKIRDAYLLQKIQLDLEQALTSIEVIDYCDDTKVTSQ